MSLAFKKETFRDDYTYQNSPEAIKRFPFPFAEDTYMYSVNIEPHTKGPVGAVTEFAFDIDEHYVAECEDKAKTLALDAGRYQALPHMAEAQWDFLELTMESLTNDYPELFSLKKDGLLWTWKINRLGLKTRLPLAIAPHLTWIQWSIWGDRCKVTLCCWINATVPCTPMLALSPAKRIGRWPLMWEWRGMSGMALSRK